MRQNKVSTLQSKSPNYRNYFYNLKNANDRLYDVHNLKDFVQRKKNQSAEEELDIAIQLLRQNLNADGHAYNSKLLLARLLIWTNKLEECIEICDSIIATRGFDYLALHIRGVARLQTGDIQGAIKDLKPINKVNPFHGLLAWNLAIAYFYDNQFTSAWDVFSKSNSILPNTYHEVPFWSGEELDDKSVVLTQYNSKGGGDDIMYAHLIPEILEKTKTCYIETDPRTQSLYENSFNQGIVFISGDSPWTENTEIDFQVMVPTLAEVFRRNTNDFDRPCGYLQPNKKEKSTWQEYINNVAGSNLKVGICWRSMISIGLTGPMSTPIEAWGNIFKVPGITFFELQYDESEEERQRAETLFGVDIHKLENVDLMKDFEKITAITLSMDIVISTVTTISLLANAAGAQVWELRPDYTALCMSGLPWFPNRKIYSKHHSESWGSVLNKLAIDLDTHAGKNLE